MISSFFVGQIPSSPYAIQIVDNDGQQVPLAGYAEYEMLMLDPRNNIVDLTGGEFRPAEGVGKIFYLLPQDRSVFTSSGEYVFQVILKSASGSRDITSEHTVRVRDMGGRK